MIELKKDDKVPGSGILTIALLAGHEDFASRRDPPHDRVLRQHGHEPGAR